MSENAVRRPLFGFGMAALIIVAAIGGVTAIMRFALGLGATTNLSDDFPWGLWVSFDLLSGVALAAGAFTIAAFVYVLNLKKYKPLVRPAILTGFLGYSLAAVALLMDLGRPYRIWRPMITWQPHSVLFEVAWCMMLYTTVLAIELSPVFLEKLKLERPLRFVQALTVPLVIVGAILSVLHQSSLGALFLLVPGKLHPLWYSRALPLFFFISAVAVALPVIIVESVASSKMFQRGLEMNLLSSLAKCVPFVLGIYFVVKIGDLAIRGELSSMFGMGVPNVSFLLEMLVGVALPAALFSSAKVRASALGLVVSSLLVIGGVILNRVNVTLIGMHVRGAAMYFPSWMELSITAAILAFGLIVFLAVASYFPVFPRENT